jgi:hypothetical protein
VRAAPYDPVRSLYRTLLVFDLVAILILAVGLGEFLYFEPPGQGTGVKATIVGVYQYDPATRTTTGPDRRTFLRTEQFAAVVDWTSLPQNTTVDARWYDSSRQSSAGSAPAHRLSWPVKARYRSAYPPA